MTNQMRKRLQKYFHHREDVGKVTVVEIIDGYLLLKVPHYVRHALIEWARGRRPGVVMIGFPTPLEVYNMMCAAERCVSCLISIKDITSIVHDDYPPFEDRNGLSFLFHDIKHLEKFVDPIYYSEQVAFLRVMRPLCTTSPNAHHCFRQDIIAKYDEEFAADMDHLLSDMNACSPHLLQFFKAKWIDGEYRRCVREEKEATTEKLSTEQYNRLNNETFSTVFQEWKDHLEHNEPTVKYTDEDWDLLRKAFDNICTDQYNLEESFQTRQFYLKYGEHSPLVNINKT